MKEPISTQDLFTHDDINSNKQKQKLLPWWMKIFIWLFIVIATAIPVLVILAILGYNATLAIYGLETNNILSIYGGYLMAIFILKGVTSYGLLAGKKWAIIVGICDAFIGILICLYTTFGTSSASAKSDIGFRLELLFLFPYLLKLYNIKSTWNNLSVTKN